MNRAEFMNRLFDVLNESDDYLSVQDIAIDVKLNIIKIYLTDGRYLKVNVESVDIGGF